MNKFQDTRGKSTFPLDVKALIHIHMPGVANLYSETILTKGYRSVSTSNLLRAVLGSRALLQTRQPLDEQ